MRILIIDDHRDYRMWLANHVGAAYPAAAVVDYAPRPGRVLPPDFEPDRWDLVFLDHRFGDEDGLAWLKSFKSLPNFPPIVFLTPQGDQDAVLAAIEAGADDYLPKEQVGHEHISRVVREALRRGRRTARPAATPVVDDRETFGLKGHRFLKQIGGGSSASVYLMEDRTRGDRVVVKVFRHGPDEKETQALFQRFLREYEVISRIRHPHVVRIHDLGVSDDMAYIAMEYFAGGDLGAPIARGMDPESALEALGQMASALCVVHAEGVLHRDLKPGNVMLREGGQLALIDFGLAKLRDAGGGELTVKGEIFGTPYYMSPEQGHGAPVDERSDLYSLGIVLHEMLTGRKPYVAASPMAVIWKHRHAPVPTLPEPLGGHQALLNRLVAKEPADRFASAAELLDFLAR